MVGNVGVVAVAALLGGCVGTVDVAVAVVLDRLVGNVVVAVAVLLDRLVGTVDVAVAALCDGLVGNVGVVAAASRCLDCAICSQSPHAYALLPNDSSLCSFERHSMWYHFVGMQKSHAT